MEPKGKRDATSQQACKHTVKAAEGESAERKGGVTVMPGVKGHNLTCKNSHGKGKAYKMIVNKTVAQTTQKKLSKLVHT